MKELTMTWHIHGHVHVQSQETLLGTIDAEFGILPTQNEVSEVVEDEEKGENGNEDGKETSLIGARLVSGGELRKCIELNWNHRV